MLKRKSNNETSQKESFMSKGNTTEDMKCKLYHLGNRKLGLLHMLNKIMSTFGLENLEYKLLAHSSVEWGRELS